MDHREYLSEGVREAKAAMAAEVEAFRVAADRVAETDRSIERARDEGITWAELSEALGQREAQARGAVSADEAADLLGVGRSTFYTLVRDGAIKKSGRGLFSRDSIERYLKGK